MKFQFLLPALLLAACSPDSAEHGNIALLGDDARAGVAATCGDACSSIRIPNGGASASDTATLAKDAKLAILVVDAANGPLPVTRQHILVARQAGIPEIAILVVNSSALDGLKDKASLIDAEVTEVRLLMDKYEMHGNSAKVAFDHAGLKQLLAYAESLPPRRAIVQGTPHKSATAFVYNLSTPESSSAGALTSGDRVTLWVNGQNIQAKIGVNDSIPAGGLGELRLLFDAPIGVTPGLRFFIERNKQAVTAGVVTSVDG